MSSDTETIRYHGRPTRIAWRRFELARSNALPGKRVERLVCTTPVQLHDAIGYVWSFVGAPAIASLRRVRKWTLTPAPTNEWFREFTRPSKRISSPESIRGFTRNESSLSRDGVRPTAVNLFWALERMPATSFRVGPAGRRDPRTP